MLVNLGEGVWHHNPLLHWKDLEVWWRFQDLRILLRYNACSPVDNNYPGSTARASIVIAWQSASMSKSSTIRAARFHICTAFIIF